MTDQQLRELVREAVARYLEREEAAPFVSAVPQGHSSHRVFALTIGGDVDGSCLIEPAVRCNHCRYCQSYGH